MLKEDDKKFEANFDVTTEVEFEHDPVQTTYENTSTLRRVPQSIPIAACFILVNEFWYVYKLYSVQYTNHLVVKGKPNLAINFTIKGRKHFSRVCYIDLHIMVAPHLSRIMSR
jgi:hypothetical protein